MTENWIKVDEIEYDVDTLSDIYEQIDDFNNTQNLEKLIEDYFIIQELKNYSIPYKCRWLEKLVQTNLKFQSKRTKYWIEILIPKNYKAKYDKMLKDFESDNIDNSECENIDSYNKRYETMNKVSKIMGKGLFVFLIFAIIYTIWQSIINNIEI